jgi:hypothetical protein
MYASLKESGIVISSVPERVRTSAWTPNGGCPVFGFGIVSRRLRRRAVTVDPRERPLDDYGSIERSCSERDRLLHQLGPGCPVRAG